MKLFIFIHKSDRQHYVKTPDRVVMQVGYEPENFALYRDNIKDNIADKNRYYSELTGIYWIWKNVKEDIIGVFPYRVYFINRYSYQGAKIRIKPLREEQIKELLTNFDVIVPGPIVFDETVEEQFNRYHGADVMKKMQDIIKNKCPEYEKDFDKYIMRGKVLYSANAMIAKKEFFDAYCQWMFPLIEELELKVDPEEGNREDKRVFGAMSERLFTLWLLHNKEFKFFQQKTLWLERLGMKIDYITE